MEQSKKPETSAERYRRRADELRALAKTTRSEGMQRELLLLVQQYEKLADDMARVERWRSNG